MGRTQIETECKLIAPNAAALGHVHTALREICGSVRYARRELIEDVYLDTKDWRLHRAKLACRIRRCRAVIS